VFCDLRGYTALTETAEPEEVLDFLREYHGALGPLVSQFEGTLDQFSGDGIMGEAEAHRWRSSSSHMTRCWRETESCTLPARRQSERPTTMPTKSSDLNRASQIVDGGPSASLVQP
jgi:class 3 adenylate cyclase